MSVNSASERGDIYVSLYAVGPTVFLILVNPVPQLSERRAALTRKGPTLVEDPAVRQAPPPICGVIPSMSMSVGCLGCVTPLET